MSLHEVSTAGVQVSSSITHLAARSGHPQCQCHGTRCQLCSCASSSIGGGDGGQKSKSYHELDTDIGSGAVNGDKCKSYHESDTEIGSNIINKLDAKKSQMLRINRNHCKITPFPITSIKKCFLFNSRDRDQDFSIASRCLIREDTDH